MYSISDVICGLPVTNYEALCNKIMTFVLRIYKPNIFIFLQITDNIITLILQ